MKTLKRDYVQVTPSPDAQTVIELIGGWIEDYNENYPHSGLKMRSPRELIAAHSVFGETGARTGQERKIAIPNLSASNDFSKIPRPFTPFKIAKPGPSHVVLSLEEGFDFKGLQAASCSLLHACTISSTSG